MKIRITFKDPDGVADSICDAVTQSVEHLRHEMTDREFADLRESRSEDAHESLQRWIRHSEYLTVEFDLEAGTAVVQEQKP